MSLRFHFEPPLGRVAELGSLGILRFFFRHASRRRFFFFWFFASHFLPAADFAQAFRFACALSGFAAAHRCHAARCFLGVFISVLVFEGVPVIHGRAIGFPHVCFHRVFPNIADDRLATEVVGD